MPNNSNNHQDNSLKTVEHNQVNSSKSSKSHSKLTKTFKKYWWTIPLVAIILAIGGVTVMRLREDSTPETTENQTTPLSVTTVTAVREPIQAWVASLGIVRAAFYQHLTFEVEGDVTYLADRDNGRLREGDFVTKGELLAKVDDRELNADLQQARAALAEARQQQAAARAQVAQTIAQLNRIQSTQNLAETQLQRYQFLYNEGAISESELDTRLNTLFESGANVQAAEAEVEAARQQLKATQAQIDTAQARVTQAKVALEGTRIYAPFDGVIAYLNYTEGEYFSPQIVTSQLGGDYQGILERIPMVIIDPSLYEVIIDLAGPTGQKIRVGQEALIVPESAIANSNNTNINDIYQQNLIEAAKAEGEVFSVNPAISPGERTVEARVRLNPETTSNIRHGEQVLTWIAVETADNAVVVPLNAIVYRDQSPYIFVVNQEEETKTIEQRQVKLGIRGISKQQILQGVEAGESVVTKGQNRLVEGAPVQIVQ